MLIKLLVGEVVLTVLSVYAPQTGLEESTKDAFYDSLQTVISELPDKEIVIPCRDWNGHVGREAAGYEGVHGGSGYGERNADGDSPWICSCKWFCHWEYFLCQKR